MSHVMLPPPARPHLLFGNGIGGEVGRLRTQLATALSDVQRSGISLARFMNVPTDAADTDGIKLAFASTAAPVTLVAGTDFDGVLARGTGPAIMRPAKRVTIIVAGTGTPANWLGGNVVVRGTSASGATISETVVSAAGAGTATTVLFFATVTGMDLPAASGTAASLTIGVAADTASIASLVSSASAQRITAATQFNNDRIGQRDMPIARRLSCVFNNNASWTGGTITFRCKDARGLPITVVIAVPVGGNATVNSNEFVTGVLNADITAQGGGAGTCAVGFLNAELGLEDDPLTSVVAMSVLREGRAPGTGTWAAPSAGAVTTAAGSAALPYGKYVPANAPDGESSYVLAYIAA